MSHTDDSIFQTIQQVRTPGLLEEVISSAWIQWSKRITIVKVRSNLTHYRPFRGGRVMLKACVIYRNGGQAQKEIDLFLQIYSDIEAARARVEKERSRRHERPPLFIPKWRAVLWTLPDVPRLRKLKELMGPDNFRRFLLPETEDKPGAFRDSPLKLFRFVPRKRAILTWEHPRTHRRYFVKLFNKTDALRVSNNYRQIMQISKQGKLDFIVPELISYNPSCRALLMTEIPGKTFTEEMRKTIPGSFARVGRILGQLHKSQAKPEMLRSPEEEIDAICAHMGEVKLALPHLGVQLNAVTAILADAYQYLPIPKRMPIHGNLFGDQILYGQKNIGIVDWDAFCCGDPLYDVGRLIAHLLFLGGTEGLAFSDVNSCTDALLQGYQDEVVEPVNRQWLSWHVTAQLLMRGKISSLRKLPKDWIGQMTFVVKEAERLVHGRSRYMNLPALNTQIKRSAFSC
jgi:aminoglycoside phosphotransferase (APT) family kinase protein